MFQDKKQKPKYVYKTAQELIESGAKQRKRGPSAVGPKVKVIDMTGKEKRVLSGETIICSGCLTPNFLVVVVNTLNTQTHSCKEMAECCFQNAQSKSISYCKQRKKSKLSLSSECVGTKLCKPYISFTSHLYSLCGMVWCRTLRVHCLLGILKTCFQPDIVLLLSPAQKFSSLQPPKWSER